MVRKVCKGTIHVHVLVAHVHGVVVCGYLSWCARTGSLQYGTVSILQVDVDHSHEDVTSPSGDLEARYSGLAGTCTCTVVRYQRTLAGAWRYLAVPGMSPRLG